MSRLRKGSSRCSFREAHFSIASRKRTLTSALVFPCETIFKLFGARLDAECLSEEFTVECVEDKGAVLLLLFHVTAVVVVDLVVELETTMLPNTLLHDDEDDEDGFVMVRSLLVELDLGVQLGDTVVNVFVTFFEIILIVCCGFTT